jgi:hypothetical protein
LFKSIAFLILITQLQALQYRNDFQIGLGYDSNTLELKPSPFEEFDTKKENKNKNIKKIIQIKSYEELFDELGLEKQFYSLESKIVKKLLNNQYINNYTLTYLIYNRVINYQTKLYIQEPVTINIDNNFTNHYGTSYINSIDFGGEYIALIHIKTNSVNDYKKIEKVFNKKYLSWQNIDKFMNEIKKLSSTHSITFKNIINADNIIVPANNLKNIIENAKNFSKDIHNKTTPYRVELRSYDYKKEQNDIIPYLKAKLISNNFEFIERNKDQFKKNINLNSFKNISSFLSKTQKYNCYPSDEFINSLNYVTYPKRYRYNMIKTPIKLEPINLAQNIILKKYKKIDDKIIFKLNYDFDIKIKNSGKIVLINWTKSVYENEKEIHREKNSKILLDGYVNYKGLKAINLTNNNFGTLTYTTKFDCFEKNETIEGQGIIENANCGYSIDNIGTINISCKNIKLKKLDIKFQHDE